MKPELSLSVPLYNEQDCVGTDIFALIKAFEKRKVDYELLLVDNGSKDRTGELIDALAKKYKKVRAIHLKRNQGFGGGINAGLREASGRFVGFTCSDGQVSPDDTLKVLKALRERGLDVAKTRRTSRHDGWQRKVLSAGYNAIIAVLFLLPIIDINGYPVIMRREVYRHLDLKARNWMINVEILTKARRHGYRIGDVPVTFLAREQGSSHVKLSTPMNFMGQLLRYRLFGPQ